MQEGASQKGLSASPAGQTVASSSGNTEPAETARTRKPQASPGLEFPRFFSTAGVDPFDQVEWELRDAIIGNEKGSVVFEQRSVEMPKAWSQQATNIVVSKYFRGHVGSPDRERPCKTQPRLPEKLTKGKPPCLGARRRHRLRDGRRQGAHQNTIRNVAV